MGKTTLLTEFAKKHDCFYFLSQEKNIALNIKEFSLLISSFFKMDYTPSFSNYSDLISFLSEKIDAKLKKIQTKRFV